MVKIETSKNASPSLHWLSSAKTGKARAIRFSTLEMICKVLDCQPGDIMEYVSEK